MQYEIPGHLLEKMDGITLKQFLKENDFYHSGSKDMMLTRLLKTINTETDTSKKDDILRKYHDFLLKTIKHNNNRIVVTYPIFTTQESPYYSIVNLLSQFEVDTIEQINFSNVILESRFSENFQLIYRNIIHDEGLVIKIENCFVRLIEYENEDRKPIRKFEYVWSEIDPVNDTLRLMLSENSRLIVQNTVDSSRSKVQKTILDKLKREYGVLTNSINERETLFKIYKHLTAHLENPYSDTVEPFQDNISEFVSDMKVNLNIEDSEDIGLDFRVRKLLERNLIQKDFKAFRVRKVEDGRVLSINFADTFGGSVKATSGGSFFNGTSHQELNLQDSDVYFDTKESIYRKKELSMVTVAWNNQSGLEDDRFNTIEVRYSAYQGFYITHFLKYNVRGELYDYVLPKFNEYKRKSID